MVITGAAQGTLEGLTELNVELVGIDGHTVLAKASVESLTFLNDAWGINVEGFRLELASLLEECQTGPDGVLSITDPMAMDELHSRFASCCVCREKSTVRVDLVWHDADSGLTGPESVPLMARARMLLEVQRSLQASGASDALIGAYLRWDAAFHTSTGGRAPRAGTQAGVAGSRSGHFFPRRHAVH